MRIETSITQYDVRPVSYSGRKMAEALLYRLPNLREEAVSPTANQALRVVDEILSDIPDSVRRIIDLHYVERRSWRSIAREYATPARTIQDWAMRVVDLVARGMGWA